jgi:Domain of unknown function (DUF5615)
MRFLADQDVYGVTIQFLRGLGHDVATAAEWGMSQSADEELLRSAHADRRVFVTRDRDFGALVFAHALDAGVLYLRRCRRRCWLSTRSWVGYSNSTARPNSRGRSWSSSRVVTVCGGRPEALGDRPPDLALQRPRPTAAAALLSP